MPGRRSHDAVGVGLVVENGDAFVERGDLVVEAAHQTNLSGDVLGELVEVDLPAGHSSRVSAAMANSLVRLVFAPGAVAGADQQAGQPGPAHRRSDRGSA